MSLNPLNCVRPLNRLASEGSRYPVSFAGTAFAFACDRLMLTAAHCVQGADASDLSILGADGKTLLEVGELHRHPNADVAALVLTDVDGKISSPLVVREPTAFIGDPIHSFGFPFTSAADHKRLLQPRLFSGWMQRLFEYQNGPWSYVAGEMSFPAPAGLSGGPVFHQGRNGVVGIVAANTETTTIVDYYEEHNTPDCKEIHKISKVVSYGVCVMISGIRQWLDPLVEACNA